MSELDYKRALEMLEGQCNDEDKVQSLILHLNDINAIYWALKDKL